MTDHIYDSGPVMLSFNCQLEKNVVSSKKRRLNKAMSRSYWFIEESLDHIDIGRSIPCVWILGCMKEKVS